MPEAGSTQLLLRRQVPQAGCRVSAHHSRCQTAVIADKAALLHFAHKAAGYWLTDVILLSSSGSCVGSC